MSCSAEQRFYSWGRNFPMELPSEPWRVLPCQKCMTWCVGHVLLFLACISQSLRWPQRGLSAFSPLCTASLQDTLPETSMWVKNSSRVYRKVFWKVEKTVMVHIVFTGIACGDSFPNKMPLTSWMRRIWTHTFHFPGNYLLKTCALMKIHGFLIILLQTCSCMANVNGSFTAEIRFWSSSLTFQIYVIFPILCS